MPVSVEWDNDAHSIIRLVFEGQWGLDDLYPALDTLYEEIGAEQHIVDVIADLRAGNSIPNNILSIRGTIERQRPPNRGMYAVVGGNALVKTVANIFNRILRDEAKFAFVDTLEEARDVIKLQQQRNNASYNQKPNS